VNEEPDPHLTAADFTVASIRKSVRAPE
jgi:hypothetical protein